MGKGFAITSDLNLGKMLSAGYNRRLYGDTSLKDETILSRLPKIRIAAITNDTVATFASLTYAVKAAPNSRVAMGLIVGTGTNATVPMPLTSLHAEKRADLFNGEAVETAVINTEWTIRGTDKPLVELGIKTIWDEILDATSEAPGFQPFEYMTSGRYLGEIIRLVFVDLVAKDSALPASLKTKNALQTRFVSEVLARAGEEATRTELEKLFPSPTEAFWTLAHIKLLRDIAYAVQQRSSALIAAACIGLLDCVHDIRIGPSAQNWQVTPENSKPEELVIAYAGSTISQYPEWLETCQHWIDVLIAKGSLANASKRVILREALDGGIIGAGVLAGMTDKIA